MKAVERGKALGRGDAGIGEALQPCRGRRRTITFDRGSEFAATAVARGLAVVRYFCDSRSFAEGKRRERKRLGQALPTPHCEPGR